MFKAPRLLLFNAPKKKWHSIFLKNNCVGAKRANHHRDGSLLLQKFIDKNDCVVLDGGMGTALENGLAQKDIMWGAQVLTNEKGLKELENIHMSFLNNGAQIICTNSYKISHMLLDNLDFFNTHELAPKNIVSDDEKYMYTKNLLVKSVETAFNSRDKYVKENLSETDLVPLIAASVGPCGESIPWSGMTDPDRAVTSIEYDILYEYYYHKLKALNSGEPDLFAIETLPGLKEAIVSLDVFEKECPGVKTWVSFICTNENTTIDGSSFVECIEEVSKRDSVIACGVNCIHPNLVKPLLKKAQQITDKPLVCYPNSGEVWMAGEEHRCWIGGDDDDVPILDGTHAIEFKNNGATLIGGCCRVTSEQIGHFSKALLG